jgi:chemotaxis protein methyltransferase CheR
VPVRAPNARRASHRPLDGLPLPSLAEIRTQLDTGQWEAAAECCGRLLTAERMNPVLHFYHALVAQQIGSHRETEAALRRAIYLDRQFVLAHYYLGLVLQRNREAGSAMRSFRNVLDLLKPRDMAEAFADADGLTVGALRQMTEMHLDILQRQ